MTGEYGDTLRVRLSSRRGIVAENGVWLGVKDIGVQHPNINPNHKNINMKREMWNLSISHLPFHVSPRSIHYRVANPDTLLIQLRKDSVTILDKVETAGYEKFIHILDLEGNKIELWEPNDVAFEKPGISMGATTTK